MTAGPREDRSSAPARDATSVRAARAARRDHENTGGEAPAPPASATPPPPIDGRGASGGADLPRLHKDGFGLLLQHGPDRRLELGGDLPLPDLVVPRMLGVGEVRLHVLADLLLGPLAQFP